MVTELERQELIALTQRSFETQRLPRALALKAEVDGGALLRETDKQFLDEMLRDVERSVALLAPESALTPLQQCVNRLCDDILSCQWRNGRTTSAGESSTP
jgi:hypothetical protein